jgi:antitoxin MazE
LPGKPIVDILLDIVYPENQTMQVSKWGNSLAIRLPASVVEALGLKEGDRIDVYPAGRRTFEIEKTPGARELLARLRKYRGRLPKDFKFDRLEVNERR